MSISSKNPPPRLTVTQLTEMDKAVIVYQQMGEDFIETLDLYLNSPPEFESYIFKGPDYLLLGHRETREDPCKADSPNNQEPYWYITYGGTSQHDPIKLFLQMMPYRLDRVAFARYSKDPTRRIRRFSTTRLIKYYGLKT